MIFGSPDNFAIYLDKVENWCNGPFVEGFICFYINELPFPSRFYEYVSTLNTNTHDLTRILLKPKFNKELFEKDKLELSKHLLKARYPACVFNSQKEFDEEYLNDFYKDEDFDYEIDVDFLIRANLPVFAIKNDKSVRILLIKKFLNGDNFLNLTMLKEDDIEEVVINSDTLENIINNVIKFYEDLT